MKTWGRARPARKRFHRIFFIANFVCLSMRRAQNSRPQPRLDKPSRVSPKQVSRVHLVHHIQYVIRYTVGHNHIGLSLESSQVIDHP